jgi:hypothetical protein
MGANRNGKGGRGGARMAPRDAEFSWEGDFSIQKSKGERHFDRRGREKTKRQQRKNEKLMRKAEFFVAVGDHSRERRVREKAWGVDSNAGSPARKNAEGRFGKDKDSQSTSASGSDSASSDYDSSMSPERKSMNGSVAGNRSGRKSASKQTVANGTGDAWVADVGCGSNRKGAHFSTDMRDSRIYGYKFDTVERVEKEKPYVVTVKPQVKVEGTKQMQKRKNSFLEDDVDRDSCVSPKADMTVLKMYPGVVRIQIDSKEESINYAEQYAALAKFEADAAKKEKSAAPKVDKKQPIEWYPEMEMYLNAIDRDRQRAQNRGAKKSFNASDAEEIMTNRNNNSANMAGGTGMEAKLRKTVERMEATNNALLSNANAQFVSEPERRSSWSKQGTKKEEHERRQMTLSEYNQAQAEKRQLRCNFLEYAFIFDREVQEIPASPPSAKDEAATKTKIDNLLKKPLPLRLMDSPPISPAASAATTTSVSEQFVKLEESDEAEREGTESTRMLEFDEGDTDTAESDELVASDVADAEVAAEESKKEQLDEVMWETEGGFVHVEDSPLFVSEDGAEDGEFTLV